MLIDSILNTENINDIYIKTYRSILIEFYDKCNSDYKIICFRAYQLNTEKFYRYKMFIYGGKTEVPMTPESMSYLEQHVDSFEKIIEEITLIYKWLIKFRNSFQNIYLIHHITPDKNNSYAPNSLIKNSMTKVDKEIFNAALHSPERALLKRRLLLNSMNM